MSFKEQLKTEILPKTVDYYNSGMDINSAIVKAAEDFKLNLDQTDRLLETMNTARVIAHYEKNASDRTANCDIADKDTVRRLLYADKPQEKTASAEKAASWDAYASYAAKERNYRKPAMEKVASSEPTKREPTGFTVSQMVEKVAEFSQKMAGFRRFAEERRAIVGDLLTTQLHKIAQSLSKGYEPEARWALFKAACSGPLQTVAVTVETEMPKVVLKDAVPHLRKLARANVIDPSPVSGELALAKEALETVAAIQKIATYIEDFAKREQRAKALLRKQAEINKLGASFGGGPPPSPSPGGGSGGSGGGAPKSGKGDKKDKSDEKKSPWLSKTLDALNPADTGAAKLYDYVHGGMLSTDLITESLKPKEIKPSQSIKNYIDNIRRSALITELYSDDPILSEAKPEEISRAYNALVQNAPEISLNKEVVRAILRQSVNSVAISPFDAKQWADLGSVLARNKNTAVGRESRTV